MALILSLAVSSFPNPMSCKLICHPKSVSMNSTTQFHRLKRYVGLLHYSRILFFFSFFNNNYVCFKIYHCFSHSVVVSTSTTTEKSNF